MKIQEENSAWELGESPPIFLARSITTVGKLHVVRSEAAFASPPSLPCEYVMTVMLLLMIMMMRMMSVRGVVGRAECVVCERRR